MSLIVTALIVGGGAVVAGVAARIVSRRRTQRAARAREAEDASTVKRSRLREAGFELEQGDVISVSGRELWLESGWILCEGGEPIAALLFAHEAVVLALPKPRARLYHLNDVELELASDPPSALDHAGARYERARRLPIEIEPLERSADPPWQSALLVEYRGLGDRAIWALVHAGSCRAWSGRVVDPSEVESWGGGASTLES